MGKTKKRLRDFSVQTKLTFLTATAITLAVTFCCVIFVILDVRRISASKVTKLTAIAEILATNSTAAIAFGQDEAAKDLLQSTLGNRQLLVACILDPNRQVFAICQPVGVERHFDPAAVTIGAHYTDDGFLDVAVPIYDDADLLGTLFLRESTDELDDAIQSRILAAMSVLAISILIGVFASSQLQESVTAPILNLASTAKQISHSEDYAIRVTHECDDEIGVLYRQFNGMLDRVESREKAVAQANERLHELNQELEQRVADRTEELEKSNFALQRQMVAKDSATEQLRKTHAQLLDVSRRAGMADIANGVLHNIGNVLNSLNISANLIDGRVRDLKFKSLEKAIKLLIQNDDDLSHFLTETEQGKILPRYLDKLTDSMICDQLTVLEEVESLASNVEHIKDIVRAQQSHAGAFGVMEQMRPELLFDDAIYFVESSFSKHQVEIVKDYDEVGTIQIEKSKAIQIIVNLIKNAKESVLEHGSEIRRVTLRLRQSDEGVCFEVIDRGLGIAPERLTTIFSNGFTTKRDGHGFGLHSSATAALELGGKLSAHSDGVGRGATFTLLLPASSRIRRSVSV